MPIYEYQRTSCGEKVEVRQSIGEGVSKLNCPKCNAKHPRRLFFSFFSPESGSSGPSDISCPTCSTGTCGLPPVWQEDQLPTGNLYAINRMTSTLLSS